MSNLNDDDLKILYNHNKNMMKHFSNALIRHIIIYLLKKESLYGYILTKKINEFFDTQIESGIMNKIPTSKVYPILNKMESENLIKSKESEHNNMKIKLYSTTELGEEMYNLINVKIKDTTEKEIWRKFLKEIFN